MSYQITADDLKKFADAQQHLRATADEMRERVLTLEQRMSAGPAEGHNPGGGDTLADRVMKSDQFRALMDGRGRSMRVELPMTMTEIKTAIVNATGASQPLVAADRRPGIVTAMDRSLRVLDLIPRVPTSSNMVEYTKENVFTNAAGPQYGSPAYENVAKPESGITFTLESRRVETYAHFIPVSRQVLSDSPGFQQYLNARLVYGLLLAIEIDILNGDGTQGALSGLLDSGNYTAYTRAVSGDTAIDTLRRAVTQLELANHAADAILLNPADWEDLVLTREGSGTGQYLMGAPTDSTEPRIFGVRVVPTNSIDSGTFVCADLANSVFMADRQAVSVEIAFEHSENFTKNMATVLAETRLALCVTRPTGIVSGSL